MKSTAEFASSYFWHHENLIKKVEPPIANNKEVCLLQK